MFIWRGSIACGGGRAAALDGNVQCKQPRWQQAEGVAVLQPGSAASGVAGTGVKPLHPRTGSWCCGQLAATETTTTLPRKHGFL